MLMMPRARPLFLSKYRQTTVMMAVYSRPTPTPETHMDHFLVLMMVIFTRSIDYY